MTPIHHPQRLAIALALLAMTLPLVARAQDEPAAPGNEEFFDTVDVNVVNVEVYVTDRSGNLVTDLERDDFEVLEDGRQVTVSNFYKVVDGRIPGEPATAEATAPATPGAAEQAPSVPDDQRLYVIVYVDNLNIRPFNRNRVFRRLRDFLREHVGRDDKVMLVTYDRTLKERVPFTSDPALVSSALFEIEEEAGMGVHDDSERRDALRWIEESDSVAGALVPVKNYAGSKHNDMMFTIDALAGLVANLGGLEGRKALLYVSDGLPRVPADDLFYAVFQKFNESSVLMESRQYDTSRRFQELAAQANANRVAFYTIDAAGLRTPTSASVETSHAGIGTYVDSQHFHNLQGPLIQLADATGGRAIINTNDVGPALADVGRELRTYYSLGYQPAHSGDGRYHRIEVRVKGKGYRVRHRDGYRDKTIAQRMGDITTAGLVFGEGSNPLGIKLVFGDPRPREEGHFLVPIRVAIPLAEVTMVERGAQHEARLRLFLSAMDAEGGTSPVQEVALPIRIPSAEVAAAETMGWGYDVTLLMRRGLHRVAVGVRDELAGTHSLVTGRIQVSGP